MVYNCCYLFVDVVRSSLVRYDFCYLWTLRSVVGLFEKILVMLLFTIRKQLRMVSLVCFALLLEGSRGYFVSSCFVDVSLIDTKLAQCELVSLMLLLPLSMLWSLISLFLLFDTFIVVQVSLIMFVWTA